MTDRSGVTKLIPLETTLNVVLGCIDTWYRSRGSKEDFRGEGRSRGRPRFGEAAPSNWGRGAS